MNEHQLTQCLKVLNEIKHMPIAAAFIRPIIVEDIPGYSDVIDRPISISEVMTNTETNCYRSMDEFKEDTLLIFDNAIKFWGQYDPNDVYKCCAYCLKEKFLKKFSKVGSSPEIDWLVKVRHASRKFEQANKVFEREIKKKLNHIE